MSEEQSKYDKAEPLYERVLAIRKKVLGAEHPNTALDLCNLAFLYIGQGEYDQATSFLERALAIFEKVLGSEHQNMTKSLQALAICLRTV
ncbi:Tetratricopeptide repeat-domain-containing protein [Jimgerdemannia flammicorona]|uniref:Tetratricopeptide repeat-domain-containing protein n=1 Tax=Jimgerdemannia flammicorona TaxID=994334 RepID=A0A433D3C1_9FUNG|nr:Tetratricopeptide repeat-domain-containing protein [Jimgerdemannia flammicorona]